MSAQEGFRLNLSAPEPCSAALYAAAPAQACAGCRNVRMMRGVRESRLHATQSRDEIFGSACFMMVGLLR